MDNFFYTNFTQCNISIMHILQFKTRLNKSVSNYFKDRDKINLLNFYVELLS